MLEDSGSRIGSYHPQRGGSEVKIGVIGAGNIGGTIGTKWASQGHEVYFGVRDPQRESLVEKIGGIAGRVQAGYSKEAIAFADVITFAVPGASVGPIVEENLDNLRGKIIIDASNNMRGESRHALGYLRDQLPKAKLYRAFSSLGWENLAHPEFEGIRADLFYCGDEAAKTTVDQLINDIGLEPIYLGGTDRVTLVEGMTDMWFNLALKQGMGRRLAFKLLT